MKKHIGIILILTVLIISGCSSVKTKESQQVDNKNKVDSTEETSQVETADDSKRDTEYPLPILDGWEEIEISFKTMGEGQIELWSGEFSYEESSNEYFEAHQTALKDEGFEVEIKDNAEGFQSLHFTNTIDGKDYVCDALFRQNWVNSSLQHFK